MIVRMAFSKFSHSGLLRCWFWFAMRLLIQYSAKFPFTGPLDSSRYPAKMAQMERGCTMKRSVRFIVIVVIQTSDDIVVLVWL